MRKIIYVILVLVLIAGLVYAIAGINEMSGNGVKEQQAIIKIGGLFHLSGPGSFWGQGELNGAMLALEEINEAGGINGKELKIIVEDGKTNFPETVTAIKKLVQVDKVEIIIGPTWFGQVASPLAEELKVLIISPSAGVVPEPNDYFFDVWPTERQEIIPLVRYMKNHGIKKVAVVYSLNEWSQSMKDNFLDESKMQGIEVVEEFPSSPDEKDFRTIISKLQALDIDAVYAPFAFFPSQGAFSKQAKELNFQKQLYSSSGTENPLLLESFPSIEGTIYPYPVKGHGEEEFSKKYEKRFNKTPSPPAAYAYDTIYLIAKALREGYNSPKEISNYFHKKINNYQGVSNIISFDENGRVIQKKHFIKKVINGGFVRLE